MGHPSTLNSRRLPALRRSDRTLRRTAATAAASLAALSLASLIPACSPPAVAQAPPVPTVWVGCSDGATCAVSPSSGQVRTVTVRWEHHQPSPQQPLGDDPGANL